MYKGETEYNFRSVIFATTADSLLNGDRHDEDNIRLAKTVGGLFLTSCSFKVS